MEETKQYELVFTEDEIENFKKIFRTVDKDNSGSIDKRELVASVLHANPNADRGSVEFAFDAIDKDKSGEIDFEEFMTFMMLRRTDMSEAQRIKMIFDAFDKDKSGSIERTELYEASKRIGINIPENLIDQIYNYVDKNNDGKVDFNEFFQFYTFAQKSI